MTTAEDRITALEAAVEALVDQLQNAPALAAAPSPPPPAPPPPERWAAPADTAGLDGADGLGRRAHRGLLVFGGWGTCV